MLIWVLFLLMLFAQANAAEAACASPPFCQNVAAAGNPDDFADVTLTGVEAGNIIVVAVRGNAQGTTSSIINQNPSLTYTNLLHYTSSQGWIRDVYCAVVPAGGTVQFRIQMGGYPGTPSPGVRAQVTEYRGVSCTGVLLNHGAANGGSASSGNITTTTNAVIFSNIAMDGEIDTSGGFWSISGFTIRNPNCNQNIEPDQKTCSADKGALQAAGTHSATWSLNGGFGVMDVIIAAFPATGGGDTTPPQPPGNVSIN